MRISDKTPFRDGNGRIGFAGQVQGSFKNGIGWYPEVKAQDTVITIFNKILDRNYILLRNFTLPETDIIIPMILVGPPGIHLISVLAQGGAFSVRDDEWGRMVGDTFVSSRANLVQRIIKLGRVIKVYLNRNGFKGDFMVEPVIIAANPSMKIDLLRPAVKVLVNDEIERYAISLTQERPILNTERIADLAIALIKGPQSESSSFLPEQGVLVSAQVPAGKEIRDTLNPPDLLEQDLPSSYSNEDLGFSFNENWNDDQPGQTTQNQPTLSGLEADPSPASQPGSMTTPAFEGDLSRFFDKVNSSDASAATLISAQPATGNAEPPAPDDSSPETFDEEEAPAPAKTSRFGLTRAQIIILGAIFVFWLLLVVAFIFLINLS